MIGVLMVFGFKSAFAAQEPQPLHKYEPVASLTGLVISVASDTMVYLMSFWAVEFKRMYPNVKFSILQAGFLHSTTGFAAG